MSTLAKQTPGKQPSRQVPKRDPKVTRRYLDKVLSLNPVVAAQQMVELRWRFRGLSTATNASATSTEDQNDRRKKIRSRLELIRAEFWLLSTAELGQALNTLKVNDFPELKVGVDRLKLLSRHRDDMQQLANHNKREINLYNTFRRLVMLPPRKAGGVKEKYLRSLPYSPKLARVHRMVKMMRQEYPELYDIESDWFTQILKVKSRVVEKQSHAGGGISFDIGIPSWMYVVFIMLVFRVIIAVLLAM